MKTCRNCRCVYADDFNGKCSDCGAEMGNQAGSGPPQADLGFAFARQTEQGRREVSQEQQMKRGNYDSVKVERSVLDVARSFITVDKDKFVKAGGDLADLT